MFKTNQPKETMKHKSIIPKDEYQSYKNDFNKEILNETNQSKETMRIEKIINRLNKDIKINLIKDMKKDNDLKKYVNDIKKLNDDQFTVLINIFKKVNLNQ